jgi:hypothetical protein
MAAMSFCVVFAESETSGEMERGTIARGLSLLFGLGSKIIGLTVDCDRLKRWRQMLVSTKTV